MYAGYESVGGPCERLMRAVNNSDAGSAGVPG